MSAFTNNPDLKSNEKVLCACGSSVLLKNMVQHSKTKKHMSLLGEPEVPKVKKTPIVKPVEIDEDEDEDDEEDDDVDLILDAIAELHERFDALELFLYSKEPTSLTPALENIAEETVPSVSSSSSSSKIVKVKKPKTKVELTPEVQVEESYAKGDSPHGVLPEEIAGVYSKEEANHKVL